MSFTMIVYLASFFMAIWLLRVNSSMNFGSYLPFLSLAQLLAQVSPFPGSFLLYSSVLASTYSFSVLYFPTDILSYVNSTLTEVSDFKISGLPEVTFTFWATAVEVQRAKAKTAIALVKIFIMSAVLR